jgi:glutamate formiminotransferase / 5-formyltetrahydrofolate cyclo-ligase
MRESRRLASQLMTSPLLLSVPNVSEGRSESVIGAIAEAFVPPARAAVRLLDIHSDADHHRSVFTLMGGQGALADALLSGASAAVERIEVMHRAGGELEKGQHPHVGALDVVPLVYLDPSERGAACAEALVVADRLAEELHVPVLLYGELTADGSRPPRRRADLRRGGVAALARRMAVGDDPATAGETRRLTPDFGPSRMHPTAGATLVAARPPLVAFNLQLAAPATPQDAKRIATLVREGGAHGLPGLRAIGVSLGDGTAQVSMNVEQPFEVPLRVVVEAVARHATLASAELVGLAPAAALVGFPEDLPMPGFDPARHVIENALGCW